jgi:hypothetical protein
MGEQSTEGTPPTPDTAGEQDAGEQGEQPNTPGYVDPAKKAQAHQDDAARLQDESS